MGLILPIGGLAIALAYLCVSSLRLVFFHPLSRFPGPKLAALTDWYVAYYAWRGDLHIKTRQWHNIYGSIVRIGPNSVSFDSPSANEQINAVRAKTVKTDGYSSMSTSRTTPNTISAIDKSTHGFKRRIQSQVLSEAGLKTIEDRVLKHVQEFVKYLGSTADVGESGCSQDHDGWGPTKEMSEACNYMTYNVISDLCYGESLDLFHSSDMRWFPKAVALISRRVVMGMLQPRFNEYKLDRIVFGPERSRMLRLGAWVRERGSARAALGNNVKQRDVFHSMMNTSDPKTGEHLSEKDLWLESMMVLIAGSDTTSTAMAGTMYYLLHNPDALSSVTSEVRSRFDSVEEITPARVSSDCKFVRACIDEAMRLTPPVVHGPPRRVEAGGIQINGEYFDEGTVLQAPIYTLHHNETFFEDPDEYKPQRWMMEDESLQRAQQAFVPFHIGPYSCVGWRLAMMELTTALARIVFSYDMRLVPQAPCCNSTPTGSKCQYVVKGWMTSIAKGPVAQFKVRDE